jgi:circadian clock protein KaiB
MNASASHHDQRECQLRLYIAGHTPKSERALESLRQICDEHVAGRYAIEIIDLHERPEVAIQHRVVAIPTVMRLAPGSVKRVTGDLADRTRVCAALGFLART